jgi:enterochelin esterase-like enzyme
MPDNSYTHRVIEAHNLYSAHLSEERTIKVYLPPDYDANRAYPVVYCHDGMEFFTHGRIATIANKLIAEGRLEPLFIVGIAVKKSTRTEDYAPTGERHVEYVKFVVDECMPFVEKKYSVMADVNHRFMAGISLGAAATMSIHLRYPELFSRLLLFSGAFYDEVRDTLKKQMQLRELHAFMTVGRQETSVETPQGPYDFYRANQHVRDILRLRQAKVAYQEANGTHIWGFWQTQLPDALSWLQTELAAAE